ncbi:MAG: NAD(P)H-dependent oxidoreductase [Lachnospiraceae bacterium]|nr:NAD(P)H-dependent oxidoreductase [Lachnospiraceae bacterium]
MNVLVLNGSPKGDYSITLQTVLYLEKINPQKTFTILNVGQRIKALESDFTPAMEAIKNADVLLFAYPVYTFIAPCQLHRFIELMKEHNVPVEGKFVTQITTSKHFYDVTAHRYIQDNCQDMHMKFVHGLSADMEDLTTEQGQKEARNFWRHFCWCVKNDYYETSYSKTIIPANKPVSIPTQSAKQLDCNDEVVIVTDCTPTDTSLNDMIARFQAKLPLKSRIVNISEYPFIGGCLGCFNCATDGVCIYKDGFDSFLRDKIQTAQTIVYAFTIKDHSMGSRFKMYDDRQFCNGHRTVTMGMPVGYLVSGNLSEEENLRTIIDARAQVGGNILAGVATDEFDPDKDIDKLAASVVYALQNKNLQPQNFYGIGGMKIFRDLIYQMRGMMKADHQFYKEHGQYDFPQKEIGTVLKMYLIGALISSPKVKSKMGNKMNEGMIAPYRKVIERAGKK